MTSFLFLATAQSPYGEAVCGLEIARAAIAAGHRVVFLHPRKLEPLFAGCAFPRGHIDDVLDSLVPAIRDAVAARSIDVLVLVDAVSSFGALGAAQLRALPRACHVKVVALDLWSCHETSLVWDMGEVQTKLDDVVVEIPALRPCPVAKLDTAGAYRALPDVSRLDPDDRIRVRSELGIAAEDRVLFTASGAWQSPRMYPPGSARRIAEAWSGALALVADRMPGVRILHVGPEPLSLGPRHVDLPQAAAVQFQRWLAASDAVVSNNVMSTSVASALALDLPAVFIRNTTSGSTLAEVVSSAGHALAPDVAAWVERVLPLRPYVVSPLGLSEFLGPVMAGNPYFDAVDLCEVLDPQATAARVLELLDGDATARTARASYRERVAALPSGLERLLELIA